MLMRLLPSRYFPHWLRQEHPIVQRHLRKPLVDGINQILFGTTSVLFLLFGGLSLPMLYLLFSLIVLIQLAAGTVGKIHDERERCTWDLIRVAPFSRRELLLSTWAASLWQLNRTWLMPFYRLMQGIVIVGLMVFGLWLGNIPPHLSPMVLVSATLLIALQPSVDMYFGGMIGLLAANMYHGRAGAQAIAVGVVLLYWGVWIALTGALFLSDLNQLTALHVGLVVGICLLLPSILGYSALRVAEVTMK
jgi:hypothetical protein